MASPNLDFYHVNLISQEGSTCELVPVDEGGTARRRHCREQRVKATWAARLADGFFSSRADGHYERGQDDVTPSITGGGSAEALFGPDD